MKIVRPQTALLWIALPLLCMSGCAQDAVNNPAIAELNQKAQQMLSSGDAEGAIHRLEAARDLNPEEPNTLYNLAIAYEAKGMHDQAIPLLEKLLSEKKGDPGKVGQSLAIAYEEKADVLLNPVADEGKKTPDELTEAQKLEGKGLYEKAVAALEASGASDPAREGKIKEYIQGIREKIAKIR